MYTSTLSLALSFLLVPSFGSDHRTAVDPVVPGTTELRGLFSADHIKDLMKDEECVGIRFYTALLSDDPNSGTILGVPIDRDGKEIKGWILPTPYHIHEGLDRDVVKVGHISRNKASSACKRYSATGAKCFAASFPVEDAKAILDTGCGAVRIMIQGEQLIMSAVTIANGVVKPMGTGSTYERLSGDPCPAVCGNDPSVYLEMKDTGK